MYSGYFMQKYVSACSIRGFRLGVLVLFQHTLLAQPINGVQADAGIRNNILIKGCSFCRFANVLYKNKNACSKNTRFDTFCGEGGSPFEHLRDLLRIIRDIYGNKGRL
jgi:hypothetical protein